MKAFFQRFISNLIFGGKLALGGYLLVKVVQYFQTPSWQSAVEKAAVRLPFVEFVETAVIVVGFFFLLTWGVRFLDRTWYRGTINQKRGLIPRQSALGDFLTSPFIHSDDNHLFSNTRNLLIFSAIAVFLTLDAQAFLLATILIFLVSSGGTWIFGRKARHMGASGIVLGYFSFDVVYGIAASDWRTAVSIPLALLFGRWALFQLTFRRPNVSHEGHLFGFLSGILAALALAYLGS